MEKLDRTIFASWEYKMDQYIVRQGYWSYIPGAHETQPNPTHVDYLAWEQAASRVLYWLASFVHDHMLSYIQESKTPKEVWGNLKKRFATNTTVRKLQLEQELNNMQQRDMSIAIATTWSNAGTMESPTTTKRSAKRSNESWLQPVDNSQITPQILTITIMAECS